MHSMSEQVFLLVWEVADILRIGPKEVRKKIRDGLIRAQMSGNTWLVAKKDLDEYISKCPWRNPNRKGAK